MKIFVGLLILVTSCMSAEAQDSRVIAELSASTEKIVKNSPFTADAVSESVQTLPDGNRIVRSSTSKLYRNSEGRFRREIGNGSGGLLGTTYSYSPSITILDPVVGFKYQLDEKLMTARQSALKVVMPTPLKLQGELISPEAQKALNEKVRVAEARRELTTIDASKAELNDKIRQEELKAATVAAGPRAPVAVVSPQFGSGGGFSTSAGGGFGTTIVGGVSLSTTISRSKYESRTEKLGIQNIEGVEAEGTRTTTTIPAGAVGNERPIEITYESWYSTDLQLVVMSKHYDPRSGEQTYRLTNIVRNEPDPSLFSLPSGYRVVNPSTPVPAKVPSRPDVERAATPAKAAATAKAVTTPVTYIKNKP